MPTKAERRLANHQRRALAAMKQRPLPIADQQLRAMAYAEGKSDRYPTAPQYDPLLDVRGDASLKGTPQPVFIFPRFKSGRCWFTPPVACR